ncbi:Vegetative incompatibility protein HET-E-1 [Madurella mycetomatis]|uniref:Vegetative incompatibility protein HET-E-1 n=1 Tax=Madurella mycetomatis TaxID=100816 RepID=A0A175W5N9_9PEZI|nr:Vegetative incompatibility protein HET-E-1 [Madurella mycetomatis]
MDPLTTLGLAANVMQFVSFASSLISKMREISTSADGATSETTTLDTVYGRLHRLSSELGLASQKNAVLEALDEKKDVVNLIFAINDLSRSCKEDCDKLLNVVQTLKSSGGTRRRWQSFRLALKGVWKSDEIAGLEQRLHYTQTSLTLHVCALTNYWQNLYQRQLRDLLAERRDLDLQNSAKLDNLKQAISALGSRISAASPGTEVEPISIENDIATLEGQLSQLTISRASVAKEHTILKSLDFASLLARHSCITEAHSRTFEWLFNGANRQQGSETTIDKFLTWLRQGNGIFWISGKPGSGKSTLMKYIADHPSTIQALSAWSYPKAIVVACHYFWSAGTPIQKSQEGLLRTLLHEIFRQQPDLIELACAERWTKNIEELGRQPWKMPELRIALQRIADKETPGIKFCFFIDGLDEYEGDHVDFCRALKDLAGSLHIKLCVSSRPWNVFEDSLGRDDNLKVYVQDLTRNDVRVFAESRLQEHPRWQDLDAPPERLAWLVNQITERAAGVFLWVFLVTRDLRNGLTEYDTIEDLRRRLENIPNDLDFFFRQILESVEPFYHSKMAVSLLASLAVRQPAPLSVYGFLDDEFEDPEYAKKIPLRPLPREKLEARAKQISRRLNGRCRGLLEVNKATKCVEFLHRTVMDFLRTGKMFKYLNEKAPADFNVNISLLKAFTSYIKTTKFPEFVDRTDFAQYTASGLVSALEEGLFHGSEADGTNVVYDLLQDLERCIPEMDRTGQAQLNVWGIDTNPVCLFFREPLIKAGMAGYVRRILRTEPGYFSDFEKPVLSYVISAIFSTGCSKERTKHVEMLRCLLDSGLDPNTRYYDWHVGSTTPWNEFLSPRNLEVNQALYNGLLSLMLKHGADPGIVPQWAVYLLPESTRVGKRALEEPESNEEAHKMAKLG